MSALTHGPAGASATSATSSEPTGLDLTSLPAVGLETLVQAASLQTRVDRKYVLPVLDAQVLLDALDGRAQVLEIDGARAFDYESVYFDTPDLRCYALAARRRPARFKVRTRTYVGQATSWLEVKTRDRRGRTVKVRSPYAMADRGTLTPQGREFVSARLADQGIVLGDLTLDATLVTRYRRTTVYLPDSGSRLTLDTALTCSHDELGQAGLPAEAVVETKSSGHPTAVDRLLWSHGHRPLRISKYGAGLASLRPDLPRTPWGPVLRRHPFLTALS